MSLLCPLVLADAEVILIDTGIGNRLSEREVKIYRPERGAGLTGGLRRLGLEPEDVTMVVLSHLHFDHCGGVIERIDAQRVIPAFPRARHLIQRREWEVALRPTNHRQTAAYRHAHECLEPLRGNGIHLLDGPTSLTPSVRTFITGGHTPSHQCVMVESGGESLVHLADIAPTVPHLRPGWVAAYDLDPTAVDEEKGRLLREVIARNGWVSFDHDDRIAAARLTGSERRPEICESLPAYEPV